MPAKRSQRDIGLIINLPGVCGGAYRGLRRRGVALGYFDRSFPLLFLCPNGDDIENASVLRPLNHCSRSFLKSGMSRWQWYQ